jgi:hypothetical protein
MHLSETVRRLNETTLSHANDMGFKTYREIGVRTDASTALPSAIGSSLTNLGTDLVSAQYQKYQKHKDHVLVADLHTYVEVTRDNNVYIVRNELCECSCSFFMNFHLPCWHMFCARDAQHVSLYDIALELSLPSRWKRNELLQPRRFHFNSDLSITKIPSRTKGILHEQDRYIYVHTETDLLASYLATCGGSDLTQKLHQVQYLLQVWQAGQSVEIIVRKTGLHVSYVNS